MAKENLVLLHGQALMDVSIKYDGEVPTRAMLYLNVVDRMTETDNPESIQYTNVFVYSANQDVIANMKDIKQNDLVEIYGMITTSEISKTRLCNSCGTKVRTKSNVTYITPLAALRIGSFTEEEAKTKMESMAEISNRVHVIGKVCESIDYNDKNGTGTPSLRYQLEIKRTVRVQDDTANNECDMPWVLATGNQALEGKDALMPGSIIYIRGHLRSKYIEKEILCPKCNKVFTVKDFPQMRISPHFTEYMHNCNFPDAEK